MIPILIAAAATIGGALVGSAASAENRKAAQEASQNAIDTITALGLPPDQSKQVFYEEFKRAGILTPEMEKEINVQFEKIAAPDTKTKQAQQQALQGLAQAAKGGMTAEERVAMTQIANRQARENEAAKNSIIQNLQQRGQAGGGTELAMRLQAAQGSANQASESSDRAAAQAQARALQSLGMLGSQSNQMRGQEFSENQAQANIVNEQNRFNVAGQRAAQSANVGAKNRAQEVNLNADQNMMDNNVRLANAEKTRQMQAQHQYWIDQQSQAQAKANAYLGQATNQRQQAADTQGVYSGIGAGVGTAASTYGQYQQNQDMMDRMYPQKTPIVQQNPSSNLNYGPSSSGSEYAANMNQGYSEGGTVEGKFPNNPPAHTNNPGMLTLPAEYMHGGRVTGPEVVPGSSPANDIIHARLSSGEYVVPKEDAPSMELIHQILKGMKAKKK